MRRGVGAVGCALLFSWACASEVQPQPQARTGDPARSFGSLAQDGTFVYWRPADGRSLLRQRLDGSGGVEVWGPDAGVISGSAPVVTAGHVVWLSERLEVRPLDGGAGWRVGGTATSAFAVYGRKVALVSYAAQELSVWDLLTGAHERTLALPTGRLLGFTATGALLKMECLYRSDDAGLGRAVSRENVDGGRFEPWARASCPTSTLLDGEVTYLNDYTPPEGQLPGTTVLRRLDANGETTRLPLDDVLFVRGGVAFHLAEWKSQPLLSGDGGVMLAQDGGVLLRQVPGTVEAVSLVDGGRTTVVTLDGGLWGFAVDGQRSVVLYDEPEAAPLFAPLPAGLRWP